MQSKVEESSQAEEEREMYREELGKAVGSCTWLRRERRRRDLKRGGGLRFKVNLAITFHPGSFGGGDRELVPVLQNGGWLV